MSAHSTPASPSSPARELLRRLCSRSYGTARSLRLFELSQGLRGRQAVLVYQMGKVGSTSVLRSLEAHPGLALFHLHTLRAQKLRQRAEEFRSFFPTTRTIPRFLTDGEFIQDRLERNALPLPVKVVSLVRDPVARNVSSFCFRHLRRDYGALRRGMKALSPEEAAAELIPRFQEESRQDRYARWFEEELEAVFGVDVYAEPFPNERGYHIYRGERAEVLLLKLEHLNARAGEAFRDFLGLEAFTLVRSNDADSKDYGEIYRAFQKQLELPHEYLERCYNARATRHFYSDAEVAGFRARWDRSSHPTDAGARMDGAALRPQPAGVSS